MKIRISKEQKIKILNSSDVYGIMQRILMRETKIHRQIEHFWVVGLDDKNTIQYIELIALGHIRAIDITPMDVFRWAVEKNVPKIILCHNHATDDVTPRVTDFGLNKILIEGGKLLGIEVIDHLIISETTFSSMVKKDSKNRNTIK